MQAGREEALEVEIRMLRGALEPLAQADEVSSPQKMAAIANVALEDSRERITLLTDAEDHDRRWEPGF